MLWINSLKQNKKECALQYDSREVKTSWTKSKTNCVLVNRLDRKFKGKSKPVNIYTYARYPLSPGNKYKNKTQTEKGEAYSVSTTDLLNVFCFPRIQFHEGIMSLSSWTWNGLENRSLVMLQRLASALFIQTLKIFLLFLLFVPYKHVRW